MAGVDKIIGEILEEAEKAANEKSRCNFGRCEKGMCKG